MNKLLFLPGVLLLLFAACKQDPIPEPQPVPSTGIQPGQGVFITCEGNFMFGNSSVHYWKTGDTTCSGDLFQAANNRPLGDVCQSITVIGNRGYLVVNNSGKVEVVRMDDFSSVATINGFTSPRYLLPVSSTKAYVSDLYANRIAVVDLNSNQLTGSVPLIGQSGKMILYNGEVFVTNSESNKLYVINAQTDVLTDSIVLADGASSIVQDAAGKLWVLCSGNWQGTSAGMLVRINPATHQTEQSWSLPPASGAKELCINPQGTTLYFLQNGVRAMLTTDQQLPAQPFIAQGTRNYYALNCLPNGELMLSDAVDFVQRSYVYRYSASGTELQHVRAGINAGTIYYY
jgi:YVTN family beta-propeller protein